MKACPGYGLVMFSFALSIYYFSCVHCFDLSVFFVLSFRHVTSQAHGPSLWDSLALYLCLQCSSSSPFIHTYSITGSARVFGYTVYRGFLNRVYGISSLNTGIWYITFFEFQV